MEPGELLGVCVTQSLPIPLLNRGKRVGFHSVVTAWVSLVI